MILSQLENVLDLYLERNGKMPNHLIISFEDYYLLCKDNSIQDSKNPEWNGVKIIRTNDLSTGYWYFSSV